MEPKTLQQVLKIIRASDLSELEKTELQLKVVSEYLIDMDTK